MHPETASTFAVSLEVPVDRRIARRDFLKAAPCAAGVLTYAPRALAAPPPADVRIGSAAYAPRDYPIRPKRYAEVTLRDGFWKPKVDTNAHVTIPFEMSKRTGGREPLNGNVLEAAILSLATHPNDELQGRLEARVRQLSQQPPQLVNRGFEVAVTWYQTTGSRELLEPSIRCAELLYDDFERNDPPFNGGERDALNCVQLFRATADRRHLDLAKHYLDIRGLANSVGRSRHNQSYRPVLEQDEAVGHAVNGVTLMVSLADVGVLSGLDEYFQAAQRKWTDVVTRKLYITGGVGSTGNEGFGEPYSLPNISAYSETCAVLMFITLNHKLFLASGDSRYIDAMERGMYNNALSGVGAAGDRYFYVNRLASAGAGRDLRWQHASLECCPPNLVRFLAHMPDYIYAQEESGTIYVNLYVSSDASFEVNGKPLTISVDSDLPWGGSTRLRVAAQENVRGALKLRVPGWARNQPVPGSLYTYADRVERQPGTAVNGMSVRAQPDRKGYVTLDRQWQDGDVVELEFPMEARRVAADDRVQENQRRTAIERGPIVYCCEWPDVPGARALDVRLDPAAELRPSAERAAFDGITVIDTAAGSVTDPSAPARPVRLLPYYLWANRGAGEMTVWLCTEELQVGDSGPAGGLIFYLNPDYARAGWRYLEAAPFDQSAGTKWGCFRREIAGARGTGVGTGKQNTDDMLACSEAGAAAHLCATLEVNGVGGWFLPSRDELTLLYRNLCARGLGEFPMCGANDNFTYWASTQNTADMAVHIDFADLGRVHGDDKDFPRRVRAIRAF
jgi:hypothetical protein